MAESTEFVITSAILNKLSKGSPEHFILSRGRENTTCTVLASGGGGVLALMGMVCLFSLTASSLQKEVQ